MDDTRCGDRSRNKVGALAALAMVAATACGGDGIDSTSPSTNEEPLAAHSWDLASHMPAHLAVMFSMSWFGIPSTDPQGPGPDPSYGNSKWGGGCVPTNDPASCGTCILETKGNVCTKSGPAQRKIASRRRMLAGPYSASAEDTEGLRRVDLMLSNVRRPCDDGAKIDTWTVQLNGTRDTSAHPNSPQRATPEISYRALLGFFHEADAAGMTNAVMPGDDATWYFHFGSGVGLGKCDDSSGNPKQNCISALTQDFVDMANLSASHPSALRINGKPVLFTYLDPAHLTEAEWQSILNNARNSSGHDFYAIATIQNPTRTTYFSAFDALAPWIQLSWNNYSGSTVRQHAYNWAAGLHGALYSAVGSYPGRVVFGAATPGFDDYTERWGDCVERQLPPGNPRDPNVLLGEFDYFKSKGTKGLIGETWDDWTEGSEFEPDVAGGTSVLVSLRDQLGSLYGEAPDATGDQRLIDRWNNFGQARDCSGGTASSSPAVSLACSGGGGGGGGCSTGYHFDKVSNASVGGWDPSYVDLLMDVNGDQKDDLVVLWNNGSTFAQVSRSDGTSFSEISNAAVGAWNTSTRNLVGDFDADGKQDLVRIYPSGTTAFAQVWRSTGTGFTSAWNNAVGGWSTAHVDLLMDLNGDKRDDLVILWNNGGTTYAQVDTSSGTAFNQISNGSLGVAWNTADRFLVGDVNGDGRRDLVRVYQNGTAAYAQVFTSNGTTFTPGSNNNVGSWNSAWVDALLDADADGKSDLLVLWSNGGEVTAQLGLSNGSAFAAASNNATGVAWSAANRYFMRDVDGDKRADLVTIWPNGANAYAQVALSTGKSFAAASNASIGGSSSAWRDQLGDVSADGKADLVVLWQDGALPAGSDARAQVTLASCN